MTSGDRVINLAEPERVESQGFTTENTDDTESERTSAIDFTSVVHRLLHDNGYHWKLIIHEPDKPELTGINRVALLIRKPA